LKKWSNLTGLCQYCKSTKGFKKIFVDILLEEWIRNTKTFCFYLYIYCCIRLAWLCPIVFLHRDLMIYICSYRWVPRDSHWQLHLKPKKNIVHLLLFFFPFVVSGREISSGRRWKGAYPPLVYPLIYVCSHASPSFLCSIYRLKLQRFECAAILKKRRFMSVGTLFFLFVNVKQKRHWSGRSFV